MGRWFRLDDEGTASSGGLAASGLLVVALGWFRAAWPWNLAVTAVGVLAIVTGGRELWRSRR